MKKIIALILSVLLLFSCLTACGGKKYKRENMVKGTKEFVKTCSLDSFTFSASEGEYKTALSDIMQSSLADVKEDITDGKVEKGDVVNIDYVGTADGVAFTGGTAKGFDLTIGSNKFVPGFEDQLIGAEKGETRKITVTFPEGYNDSTDLETGKKTIKLANRKVQFSVTINGIKRSFTEVNDEFAVKAGYNNAEEFNKEAEKIALKRSIYSYLIKNFEILDYPSDEDGTPYNYYKARYNDYAKQNGVTFEQFLSYNQQTEKTFRQDVLKETLVFYACLDELKLTVPDGAVDKKIADTAEINKVTKEEVEEYYTREWLELRIVSDIVMDELLNRATITE